MANFGFRELRLAGIFGPVWDETTGKAETAGSGLTQSEKEQTSGQKRQVVSENESLNFLSLSAKRPFSLTGLTEEKIRAFSKNSAVGAAGIIDSAKTYPSLAAALGDCSLVLGTSSLHRIKPERKILDIRETAEYVRKFSPSANIAVLFGSEKTGLTHEDLSLCHAAINIPTAEEQPSMNLGQSAAIVCYELAGLNAEPRKHGRGKAAEPAVREIETLLKSVCAKLRRKFGEKWGGEYHERIIRQALLDARPNRHAVTIIKKFLG